ncbi:helix-turn-helix transcriptional regulator [Bacillus cereus]|nr:helix-turn-helix transcriptional regulator [Bacillus cereus]
MKAETIRYVRTALELTQEQFAELIGVTVLSVNRYENKVSKPSVDTLKRMRAVLNLTDEDVMSIEQLVRDEQHSKLKETIRKKAKLN